MKKLLGNLAAKITAIILSFLVVLTLAASVLAVACMIEFDFYNGTGESVRLGVINKLAIDEMYHAYNLYNDGNDLVGYYKNKNVYFTITGADGSVLSTNYNGEDYCASATGDDLPLEDYSDDYSEDGEYEVSEKKMDTLTVSVYVAKDMKNSDIFSFAAGLIDFGYPLRFGIFAIALGSLLLEIVLLCFLCCAAGRRADGTVRINHIDRIPFDIYTLFIALAVCASALLISEAHNIFSVIIVLSVVGSIDYFLLLSYVLSFATRLKTGMLIKKTLIYIVGRSILSFLKRLLGHLKYFFSNLPVVWKTVLVCGGVALISLVLIMASVHDEGMLLFWWFTGCAVLSAAAVYIAVMLSQLKKGGERIASGELDFKVDTSHMFGDFKRFGGSLNNINTGLQSAVNERMRSERLKTELITNVSHDIKTPLTSIINYVDLIKKEEPQDERIREYISVLERQSSRLKKLIEDLVEASKASTGNLSVELAPCDVAVLLSQTAGEYDERLKAGGLTLMLSLPEQPITVMADGRRLWRVFDNLMNNVCKYAQESTRVYLDLKTDGKRAVVTFRNISKYPLNISSDELMERFVRGDRSRNTEGSGLGLSIAKSLVELQGGEMRLEIDGDLFKAVLSFDTVR